MLRWNEESSQVQAAALMRPAVSASAKVEAMPNNYERCERARR